MRARHHSAALAPSRLRRRRESAPTCAWSEPAARRSPKRRCRPGPPRSRPARRRPASARGPAAAAGRSRVRGATALGLLAQAAKSTASLRPLLVTDAFARRIRPRHLRGRRRQQHREEVLVPEGEPQEPRTRRRIGEAEEGRRGPLGAGPVPLSERAGAGSPDRSGRRGCRSRSRSTPTTTRASASRQPGATVSGATAPTAADGKATVVLTAPTTLVATHGKEIPSNGAAVCVLGACPKG